MNQKILIATAIKIKQYKGLIVNGQEQKVKGAKLIFSGQHFAYQPTCVHVTPLANSCYAKHEAKYYYAQAKASLILSV